MKVGRRAHEVVEVPATFCDQYVDPPTATPPPMTTAPPPLETAVVIIGGYSDLPELGTPRPIDMVELFGCKNAPELTIALQPYPWLSYGGAATFVEDNDGGFIVSCGGYTCAVDNTDCDLSANCYDYRPSIRRWEQNVPSLNFPRYAPKMDFLPNMNASDPLQKYAVTYGYALEAEIF